MNIFYIANARIPTDKAHGRQIVNMCHAFAESGNDVRLIVPERANEIRQDAFQFYSVSKNFDIKYVHGFDFLRLEKVFGGLSFYFQTVSFLIKLFFLSVPKQALVYTRNPEVAWLFGARGYKVAYECHDWFKKHKLIALFFLKRVHTVVTTNTYIKEEFVKEGFVAGRIFVAPNGVDLQVFDLDVTKEEAVDKLSVDDELKNMMREKKVLLYTGSFTTMRVEKGIADIFLALRQMHRDDVLFVAVGGSPDDVEFYKILAHKEGVEKMVCVLGRTAQSQLALFQKASDVLLMPFPRLAHYEYHMAPLKMFEYMASGRPIIASYLPSITQILNEKNCLLCEPGNPVDLTSKIAFLLGNKTVGDALALQAYRDVQKYTWQNRARAILDYITSSLEKTSA